MLQPAESELRDGIVEVGSAARRGYVASNDGNISVRLDDGRDSDDAEERVEGIHDARHDGRHRPRREEDLAASAMPSSELLMHLEVYRHRPDVARRRARASAARDRVRGGRHPARSRRARRGRHHARQHPDRRLRHAVDAGAARRRRASTSRRTTGCCSPITARSRVGHDCSPPTTRWKRSSISRRSASSRACSEASSCSRSDEVHAPAGPARQVRDRVAGTDLPDDAATPAGDAACQVVQAPDVARRAARARGRAGAPCRPGPRRAAATTRKFG